MVGGSVRAIIKLMRGKRLKVSILIAAAAAIAISLWFGQHLRDQRDTAERENGYQTVLAQYAVEFKPGMTRVEVERGLRANRKGFKQMCCVANFKGQYVSLDQAGYDDLVKISEESVPLFCSENNVYIALEFNPKSPCEVSHTNPSDILKRVSVFHRLEGCL